MMLLLGMQAITCLMHWLAMIRYMEEEATTRFTEEKEMIVLMVRLAMTCLMEV